MNPQVEAVKKAVAILREAFPRDHISLNVARDNDISLSWFGCKTYAASTEWFRSLDCGIRSKRPNDTYTVISAKSPDGIEWTTFPDELPPTCRKIKKVERVPKTQTVETGEFIEVTREVVECGPDPDEIVAQQSQPEPESV